jgi:bis(5'-nucleosidyl)-tetraphosphatase
MSKRPVTTEYSAGGVVYRRNGSSYDVVLVQRARHDDWSLPKGHIEEGETQEEAALREVQEETGLDARIVSPLGEIVYFYHRPKKGLTRKTVYHFLMEATSTELGKPNWEVSEIRWLPITEAHTLLSYKNDKEQVKKAQEELGITDQGSGATIPTEPNP